MSERDRRAGRSGAGYPSEDGAAAFVLAGERLLARASGALWDPGRRALTVADLHLGKAERQARRGGPFLPPYEIEETLTRLEAEIRATDPAIVICLGDSFDDRAAAAGLSAGHRARLAGLAAGRRWIWIAGNHDPSGFDGLAGEGVETARLGPLDFRHIARIDGPAPGVAEVSGHHHPKATLFARGRRLSRRCFLADARRVILPAFGAYTGGLDAADPAFDGLFGPDAAALMLGRTVRAVPRRALSAPHLAP